MREWRLGTISFLTISFRKIVPLHRRKSFAAERMCKGPDCELKEEKVVTDSTTSLSESSYKKEKVENCKVVRIQSKVETKETSKVENWSDGNLVGEMGVWFGRASFVGGAW